MWIDEYADYLVDFEIFDYLFMRYLIKKMRCGYLHTSCVKMKYFGQVIRVLLFDDITRKLYNSVILY